MKKIFAILLAAALLLSLVGCGSRKPEHTEAPEITEPAAQPEAAPETEEPVQTTETTAPETTAAEAPETTVPETTQANENGLRPEFQEAMDSYEAFMDEYVAFMEEYAEKKSDPTMLLKYGTFMTKYLDAMEKFEEWDSEELNDAELRYYIQVQSRVSQKLLNAAVALP